jgi:cytochrome c oxidase subunit 3
VTDRGFDVSDVPQIAFGARDPRWWAVVMVVAIEGTMLVLLALSYGYVRERTAPWPPVLMPRTVAWLAAAELGVLVASALPTALATRAARRGQLVPMRRSLWVATALGLIAGAARWAILDGLPFRWDEHAYGSVVWALLVTQTFHLITSLGENLFLLALLHRGPVEQKHRVDVDVSGPLWYFVIAGAALTWSVVFLEILRTRPA